MEEKINFVQNAMVKLPPGFRFHPTDEELVVQYLGRKVFSYPLPAAIIPELDLCEFDPWDLPGDSGWERYFFTKRERKQHLHGSGVDRAAVSGYWKPTGCEKKVVASRTNQVVGVKKALVFYKSKPRRESRTDWSMHEYRLSDALTKEKHTNHNSEMATEEWALCRIFLRKTSRKNDATRRCRGPVRNRNKIAEPTTNPAHDMESSSPEASVITELSSIGSPSDEVNSCDSIPSSTGQDCYL